MGMNSGIKLLGEVLLIMVIPFNKLLMVDILFQVGHNLSGMVVQMSG
mgnify:CR=1 FL=1